jgi:hypothetical protein
MTIATLGAMDRSMGVVDAVVEVTAAGAGAFVSGWLGLVQVDCFLGFGWDHGKHIQQQMEDEAR